MHWQNLIYICHLILMGRLYQIYYVIAITNIIVTVVATIINLFITIVIIISSSSSNWSI